MTHILRRCRADNGAVGNALSVRQLQTAFQKTVFWPLKGALSGAERPPFAARNMPFCKAVCGMMKNIYIYIGFSSVRAMRPSVVVL